MNLSGPNQKRARRFKNQILCDLHFADMALMESSDFMQQLRNFKPQSLGIISNKDVNNNNFCSQNLKLLLVGLKIS